VSATRRLAKARRYLRSAELLLRDGDLDSAVSRAYYAVLHAAKALLMIYGHPEVEGWKTHASMLNLLAREDRRFTWFRGIQPLSGERDLQRSLTALHAQRQDADYEVGEISAMVAQGALSFARVFLERAEERVLERENQTRG